MMNKIISFSVLSVFMFMSFTGIGQVEELGLASYYGDEFHGRKTAYGDVYDKTKMTCAHKRHPYGTKLRITRIDNKKSVVVKVTDKGPFVKGRVVDLSRVAAEKIGLIQDGVVEVKVEIAGKASREDTKPITVKKEKQVESATERPKEYETRVSERELIARSAKEAEAKRATEKKAAAKKAEVITAKKGTVLAKDAAYIEKALFKIQAVSSTQTYGVQVASLGNYDNAARKVAELKGKWFKNVLLLAEPKGEAVLYKVIMGPFGTEKSAQTYQKSLAKKHRIKGFVARLPMESQTTAKGAAPISKTKAVVLSAPEVGNYGVQVAALNSFDSALRQVDALKKKWFKNILLKVEGEKYKVILGPQKDAESAKMYNKSLLKRHKIKGFVVNLAGA